MKIQLRVYESLCYTEIFEINGVLADASDFGHQEDQCPGDDYGCGDMQFISRSPRPSVQAKYNICEAEYYQICALLKDCLSFGRCGWCV